MTLNEQIQFFLSSDAFAVVGASSNKSKYGNKVLRCYLQNHKKVYPINPNGIRSISNGKATSVLAFA